MSECPVKLEIPRRLQKLRLNENGYPVPWFVVWVDGKPEFRVMDGEKMVQAVRFKLCWICGEPLGANLAFVIGPMCAVNRVSSEPPSHRECAEFSAKFCPFLSDPAHGRREGGLERPLEQVGIPLLHNPGVALVWITRAYQVFKAGNGVLFRIGLPEEALWFARGRPATRQEVMAAIVKGFPHLRRLAQEEGRDALVQLAIQYKAAMTLVPKE